MVLQIVRLTGLDSSLGLKAPVRAATSSNITLHGAQTIDGVYIQNSDFNAGLNIRVLVKNQFDETSNGIYDVQDGTWSRSADFDSNDDMVSGTRIYVVNGATQIGEWILSTPDPINLSTSNITFVTSATLFPAGGSAANPGISFATDPDTGIFLAAEDQLGIAADGTQVALFTTSSWRIGAADAAAPVAQTLLAQSVVAGTSNTAGATFTIGGSKGTGTGAGGAVQFAISLAGTTGSAQNALTNIVNLSGAGMLLWNTDNTYDIGASGATRPRSLYLGTSVTAPLIIGGAAVGSTLELRATSGVGAGSEMVTITGGNDGALTFMQFSETPTTLVNVYQESGETTRFGADILIGSDPGSHTGQEHSLYVIEHRPVGSGTNGPTNADFGMTVSTLKHNFGTTSVVGEIDGIISVVRQGGAGSDCSSYLANIAHYGTGNSSAFEGVTSIISSNVITMQVDSQIGILNNVTNEYIGFYTEAVTGTLGDAYRADSAAGGPAWTNLFNGLQVGSPVFVVTASGATTINFATVGLTVARNNSSTTSQFSIEQASTGDASMRWQIDTVRAWLAGIDNSDSQSWKLSPADDAYATAVVRIATGGGFTHMPNTAIPAGGTAGAGIMVSSTANFGIFFGSGAPSLSAAQGSIYLRSDGSQNARLYINTTGSTTWTAFNTTS